jgi:hypothetical protein
MQIFNTGFGKIDTNMNTFEYQPKRPPIIEY